MISLDTLHLARNVLASQQLIADAPDLIEIALALKKALTELDQAIAEHTTTTLDEVEIT